MSDGKGSRVPLEQKVIDTITTADVLAIRTTWPRRKGSSDGRIGADRALKRLRHLFNWAIEAGLVTPRRFATAFPSSTSSANGLGRGAWSLGRPSACCGTRCRTCRPSSSPTSKPV